MQAVLSIYERRLDAGQRVELPARNRVVYGVEGETEVDGKPLAPDQAWFGAVRCEITAEEPARLLVWELAPAGMAPVDGEKLKADIDLDDPHGYLVRCDRVDFPPGGIAFLHTHQGPGIRCLILGTFRVETAGQTLGIEPMDAWFEAGPEPVYAEGASNMPSAFVRVMILPRRLKGQSSIRYVNAEDHAKPKSQRYTVFLDEFIEL